MTAQEFSEYLEKGLGLYEKYQDIAYKYKEPSISELDVQRALAEAEIARAKLAEAEAKKPNWLLYGSIGVGVIALIVYMLKR